MSSEQTGSEDSKKKPVKQHHTLFYHLQTNRDKGSKSPVSLASDPALTEGVGQEFGILSTSKIATTAAIDDSDKAERQQLAGSGVRAPGSEQQGVSGREEEPRSAAAEDDKEKANKPTPTAEARPTATFPSSGGSKVASGEPLRTGRIGHLDFRHRIKEERRRSKSPASRATSVECPGVEAETEAQAQVQAQEVAFGAFGAFGAIEGNEENSDQKQRQEDVVVQVPMQKEEQAKSLADNAADGQSTPKHTSSEHDKSENGSDGSREGHRDIRHQLEARRRSKSPASIASEDADLHSVGVEEIRQEQQAPFGAMVLGCAETGNMENQLQEAVQITMTDAVMAEAEVEDKMNPMTFGPTPSASGKEEAPPPPPLITTATTATTATTTTTTLQRLATKEEEENDPDLLAAVQYRDLHGQPKKRKADMLANENLVAPGTPTVSHAVSDTSGDTIVESTPCKIAQATSLLAGVTELLPSEVGALPAEAPAEVLPQLEKMRLVSKSIAPGMTLGHEGRRISSKKGYRTARTNFGVEEGTYICEVTLEQLGIDGHARLGFIGQKGELQAPVGFDSHGYGYRDIDGTKCHEGKRLKFGEAFQEKDVIGMLIHLPRMTEVEGEQSQQGSIREESTREPKVIDVQAPSSPDSNPKEAKGKASESKTSKNKIIFFKNGVYQGSAFSDLPACEYFPCASIFTFPESVGASVMFNFGESSLSHNYSEILMQSNTADLSQVTKTEIAKAVKPMSTLERPVPVANMNRKWALV